MHSNSLSQSADNAHKPIAPTAATTDNPVANDKAATHPQPSASAVPLCPLTDNPDHQNADSHSLHKEPQIEILQQGSQVRSDPIAPGSPDGVGQDKPLEALLHRLK
jgi:hypothetical protein